MLLFFLELSSQPCHTMQWGAAPQVISPDDLPHGECGAATVTQRFAAPPRRRKRERTGRRRVPYHTFL
ncbi:unnamed protein product [Colias eurytheme]|nr:unnamed protein product [Colias eurytheme]